jgi:hypothetical protein
MESLKDIISDIRVFLYGGIITLPLTIAGTLSILGLFTANYAILFFLLGFLVLAPLVSFIINVIFGSIPGIGSFFKTTTSDICKLTIPYSTLKNPVGIQTENIVSSSWVAMITFFLGYVFTNGLELYNREASDVTLNIQGSSVPDINTMVTNRKAQAIIAMISTIVFGLIAIGYRFYTGCETKSSIILTTLIFVWIGFGWYQALSKVGEDRLSDLFGIANRLLPPSAIKNAPIACVPIPN